LEVTKRINKLEDKEYLPLIEKLILENVEQGDEIVYIGEQERKSINQEFIAEINKKLKSQGKKGELKLAKERLPIKGGVILGTEEIKKNASLEVLLEKIKSETETRLNQFLFYKNNEE
jgi:V/A-type H+-transporting ATPase subunit E